MADTEIEWSNLVWNPTTGCDRVSSGCDNCYALTMAKRLKGMGQPKYQRDGDLRTSGPGFGLSVHPDTLALPLRWRKPQRIFVNSMSDLFHKDVPDEFIARVWAVMAATPQHTYQILTKRHARMRSLLTSSRWPTLVLNAVRALPDETKGPLRHYDTARRWAESPGLTGELPSPLLGVWLGVSVEDQKHAELRLPALARVPAAVRFVSAEPLLGPLDLSEWFDGVLSEWSRPDYPIHWLIAGGESGHGARPMHPDWVRSLRDQCQESGCAFFFKQFGAFAPWMSHPEGEDGPGDTFVNLDGTTGHVWFSEHLGYATNYVGDWGEGSHIVSRVGKKRSGRVLDGRTWDEYPTTVTG